MPASDREGANEVLLCSAWTTKQRIVTSWCYVKGVRMEQKHGRHVTETSSGQKLLGHKAARKTLQSR